MKFDQTEPCKNCPFRTDIIPFLSRERARTISRALLNDQTFTCHKKTHSLGYDEKLPEVHCAGAMIILERLEKPNQMMRIAERFGDYKHTELNMKAPVFKTFSAFIKAQGE